MVAGSGWQNGGAERSKAAGNVDVAEGLARAAAVVVVVVAVVVDAVAVAVLDLGGSGGRRKWGNAGE